MALNLPGVPFKLNTADVGAPDLQAAMQQGFKTNLLAGQTAYAPKTMAENLLASQLQNKIRNAQAKYAEPLAQAALGLKQAELGLSPLKRQLLESQIARQQKLANDPFAGHIPTGTVGQSLMLEQVKQKYGEESPVYLDAKEAVELQRDKDRQLNAYRKSLGETAGKRSSTGLGKSQQELAEVEQGFLPGTNGQVQLSPQQQEELAGQYQLKIQKEISDVDTRKRTLFASNIDKTLDSINVKDLTQFGGLQGGIAKKINEGLALTSRETQAYRDFQKSLIGAKTLTKQIRQFYGDSITPQIQEQLGQLTNPASWTNNPRIAEENFNQFAKILKNETKTFRTSTQNRSEYQGNQINKKIKKYNLETGKFE
jgi:hypothetical protein